MSVPQRQQSKKILAALAAFVLVLALAVVTSAGANRSSGKADKTLTIWHYYDEGAGGLYPVLQTWKSNFEKLRPDVEVSLVYVPYGQMTTKVTTAAAAGKGPDMVMAAGPFVPDMVTAGALQPLDKQWASYGEKAQFPAKVINIGRFQGKLWTVQAFANVETLFYNKTILDKLGIKPPRTLAQLNAAMAKVKANAAKLKIKYPLTVSATPDAGGEFGLTPILQSQGWTYQNAANPKGLKALDDIASWAKKGYVCKCDAGGFNGAANFATGRYAFAIEGNWNLTTFAEKAKFKYGVSLMPGPTPHSSIGGEVLTLGQFSENPDIAWQFMSDIFLSRAGNIEVIKCKCTIPLRADVAKLPAVSKDPYLKVFAEVARTSLGIPLLKGSGKVSSVLGKTYTGLLTGTLSGAQAKKAIGTGIPPLVKAG